jgi:predicted amidohydrolase YtcJ
MLRFSRARGLDGQPTDLFVGEGRFTNPGPVAQEIDLEGRFVMPSFIDSHCHILPAGLDLLKLNLREHQTSEAMLDAIRDWHAANPEGWLHAVQYDQTRWPGAQHLTRTSLDQISSTRPILLRHSNGHASIANSAALAVAGVNRDTPDPKGGEFLRDEAGELNGVLLEKAHEMVTGSSPEPELEDMIEAILRSARQMRGMGITTATDMMTGRWNLPKELEAYRLASERGCPVRLRLCMQWATVIGPRGIDPEVLQSLIDQMDESRCKVIGLKVFADGAIGSATAAINSRFRTTGGQGQLIYTEENLKDIIKRGHEAGWQMTTHSIGDRSTDLVMDALEATDEPSRHRIEHVMILSDAQIERLARLGCHVSMQPEFLVRFGHAYRVQLPEDVFPYLERARSVLDAGIRLSFSTDRPIVPGDPTEGIRLSVSRPEGFDPGENITLAEALHGWTLGAADANSDIGQLGELTLGHLADFAVLSENPLETGRIVIEDTYMGGEPV